MTARPLTEPIDSRGSATSASTVDASRPLTGNAPALEAGRSTFFRCDPITEARLRKEVLLADFRFNRAMPQAARATHASHRAVLHRLGHSVGIAIAVFCIVYFAGQFLRAVVS